METAKFTVEVEQQRAVTIYVEARSVSEAESMAFELAVDEDRWDEFDDDATAITVAKFPSGTKYWSITTRQYEIER